MLSKKIQDSLDKAEKDMLIYLEDHPELFEKRVAMGYANRPFIPNSKKPKGLEKKEEKK